MKRTLQWGVFIGWVLSTGAKAWTWDSQVGIGARSTPFGLAASGQIGLNKLLWGDNQNNNVFYGYLRPHLRVQSSGIMNVLEPRIDLYPLSFLGFTAGFREAYRNTDIALLDCELSSNMCRGKLSRSFVRSQILLGSSTLFLKSSLRIDFLSSGNSEQRADEYSNLYVVEGETLRNLDVGLYLRPSPAYIWGVIYETQWTEKPRPQRNQTYSAILAVKDSKWTYLGGLGSYQSTWKTLSPNAFLAISYTFAPSLGLE